MEKNYQQKLFWLRGSALERLLRNNLLHPVLLLNMLRISQAELENLEENSKAEFLMVLVGELELVMELEMVMELVMVEDLEEEEEAPEDQLEEQEE